DSTDTTTASPSGSAALTVNAKSAFSAPLAAAGAVMVGARSTLAITSEIARVTCNDPSLATSVTLRVPASVKLGVHVNTPVCASGSVAAIVNVSAAFSLPFTAAPAFGVGAVNAGGSFTAVTTTVKLWSVVSAPSLTRSVTACEPTSDCAGVPASVAAPEPAAP